MRKETICTFALTDRFYYMFIIKWWCKFNKYEVVKKRPDYTIVKIGV